MYDDILDLVPGFREQMSNFAADPKVLDNIIDVVCDIFSYVSADVLCPRW
jgi:hypothetical protein